MIHYRKLVVIVCILHGFILSLYGQDLLNYSNSSKYAEYLFQNKNYSLSAIEYERVSFLEPTDTLAKLRMIQSYSLLHDYRSAKVRLAKLFPLSLSNYPDEFASEYFSILFHQNQYNEAFRFISENKTIIQPKRTEYELGALLMQYKWAEAKTIGDGFLLTNQKSIKLPELSSIASQGMDINYKKPGCAALLSALVPGSGKAYTKNWKDGIYSFIFISTFSWLTYNSISHNGLVFNSVFYGAITFSFYLANIYGSYKSAEKYNQNANRHVTEKVQGILFEE